MENTKPDAAAYDYRKVDQIWRRVAPEMNPYPELREESESIGNVSQAWSDFPQLLQDFMGEELSDRCAYLAHARRAPGYARQSLRHIAAEELGHARQLAAMYYLYTGECHCPGPSSCPTHVLPWCALLRELYYREQHGAAQYETCAAKVEDICIRSILTRMAADERRHAEIILQMLEKSTLA